MKSKINYQTFQTATYRFDFTDLFTTTSDLHCVADVTSSMKLWRKQRNVCFSTVAVQEFISIAGVVSNCRSTKV